MRADKFETFAQCGYAGRNGFLSKSRRRIYEKRVLVHTRLFSTKTRILSHEKNIPSDFTEVSISLYGQRGADLSIRSSQLPVDQTGVRRRETHLERRQTPRSLPGSHSIDTDPEGVEQHMTTDLFDPSEVVTHLSFRSVGCHPRLFKFFPSGE